MTEVLVEWHEADPVTEAERARSSAIAARQGNENPFVLDATLARRVFGTPGPEGPALAFATAEGTVAEDNATGTVVTVRYEDAGGDPLAAEVTAEVAFVPELGTATEGDLSPASLRQAVTFPAGAASGTTRTVTLAAAPDDVAEGSETAVFRLENVRPEGVVSVGVPGTFTLQITGDDRALVVNEVLYDPPPGPAGDAGGDGERDATDDEFIELFNASETTALDLSGYELIDDGVGVRHVVPVGTTLPARTALVVFGGGTPTGVFGDAIVQTASTGTLGLNNGGDSFTLLDTEGAEVLTFGYDGSVGDQSVVRSPELTGPFVAHTSVEPGVLFSPGRTAAGAPLPVELVRFAAQADGRAVALTWRTATETNNAGFAVEQQTEGGAWRELGFVEGAGTTTEAQRYRFRAANVSYGDHAFRLRQIDLDGTEAFSGVREVTVGLAGPYAVAAYPNPVRSRATVGVAVREAQRVTVEVYDVLGRRVTVLHDGPLVAGGTERLALSAQGLASGVYLVRVTGETFAATRRLTVVR
jgi:FlaG/FlaF family flagellin (archaellin)